MFIYSIRSATLKFIGVVALSVLILIGLIAFVPTYDDSKEAVSISYSNIYTNSDRIDFISQFGWQVNQTPIEEIEVTVPYEFDTVYLGYNEMQKDQGLNLSKYKGKDVVRFTYEITNYEDYEGTVYVNLLVYRNKVIGGDICSADSSGFVHGFTKDVTWTL